MVKRGVAKDLRDPDSAKIREVYRVPFPKGAYICGEVNGKNAYGGYAGYTSFHGMEIMGDFFTLNIDDASSALSQVICATAFVVPD